VPYAEQESSVSRTSTNKSCSHSDEAIDTLEFIWMGYVSYNATSSLLPFREERRQLCLWDRPRRQDCVNNPISRDNRGSYKRLRGKIHYCKWDSEENILKYTTQLVRLPHCGLALSSRLAISEPYLSQAEPLDRDLDQV
jgi:hypothetical protein